MEDNNFESAIEDINLHKIINSKTKKVNSNDSPEIQFKSTINSHLLQSSEKNNNLDKSCIDVDIRITNNLKEKQTNNSKVNNIKDTVINKDNCNSTIKNKTIIQTNTLKDNSYKNNNEKILNKNIITSSTEEAFNPYPSLENIIYKTNNKKIQAYPSLVNTVDKSNLNNIKCNNKISQTFHTKIEEKLKTDKDFASINTVNPTTSDNINITSENKHLYRFKKESLKNSSNNVKIISFDDSKQNIEKFKTDLISKEKDQQSYKLKSIRNKNLKERKNKNMPSDKNKKNIHSFIKVENNEKLSLNFQEGTIKVREKSSNKDYFGIISHVNYSISFSKNINICEDIEDNNSNIDESSIRLESTNINTYNLCNFIDNEIFLCQRRYSDFDAFNRYIITIYPYYLTPKLIEKSFTNKFFYNSNNKTKFMDTRIKQLSYYLNYYNTHPYLSQLEEYKKFLTDTSFDYSFYNNSVAKKEEEFPVCKKIRNSTISKKALNAFNYICDVASSSISSGSIYNVNDTFTSNKVYRNTKTINIINNYYLYFKNYFKDIKFFQSEFNKIIESSNLLIKNKEDICNAYKVIKDISFSKEGTNKNNNICNIKNPCNSELKETAYKIVDNWSKTEEEIKNMIVKNSEDEGLSLVDKLEGYVLVLNGMIDLIDRYYELLKTFENIKKIETKKSMDTDENLTAKVREESIKCESLKSEFESKVLEEIDFFIKNYYNLNFDLYYSLIEYINFENNFEFGSYKKNKLII